MTIFVLGINHKTAPVEIREKFAMTGGREDAFGRILSMNGVIKEKAILSTCNRTEIYGVASDAEAAYRKILSGLSEIAGQESSVFVDKFYFKTAPESVEHLFAVASGLDSMALGETEILGQVKSAYLKAHSARMTGRLLNVLFQKSLAVGKKVRTETEIGQGKVSIASISVDLAAKIFSNLSSKKILLVGSGEVARAVLESLSAQGARQFIIANRNRDRAIDLVERFGGSQIAYEDVDACVPEVDILISSAATPKAIIGADRVEGWMKKKHGRALFIIDLGVPRNVEGRAGELADVYLYDIDDLKSIAGQNVAARQRAVDDCRRIIGQATNLFMDRWKNNGGIRRKREKEG